MPRARACSSGRMVRRRRTPAPGPDPVPQAAWLTSFDLAHWSSCRGKYRVCDERFGGGPTPDGPTTEPRPPTATDPSDASRHILIWPAAPRKNKRVTRQDDLRAHWTSTPYSASTGSVFPLETGSLFPLGPTLPARLRSHCGNSGRRPFLRLSTGALLCGCPGSVSQDPSWSKRPRLSWSRLDSRRRHQILL